MTRMFSVITVCFNCKEAMARTCASLLEQDCSDYEFIVIDGGSSDGTVDVFRSLSPRLQDRMRWISEKDDGIYDAMNKGISRARGEYVHMLNAGDVFEGPHVLSAVAAAIGRHPGADVYFGRTIQGCEELTFSAEELPRRTINHQACFIARAAHRQFGGYALTHHVAADYAFLLKLFLNHCRFVSLDMAIVKYDLTGFSECNIWRQVYDFHSVQREVGLIGGFKFWLLVLTRYVYKTAKRLPRIGKWLYRIRLLLRRFA